MKELSKRIRIWIRWDTWNEKAKMGEMGTYVCARCWSMWVGCSGGGGESLGGLGWGRSRVDYISLIGLVKERPFWRFFLTSLCLSSHLDDQISKASWINVNIVLVASFFLSSSCYSYRQSARPFRNSHVCAMFGSNNRFWYIERIPFVVDHHRFTLDPQPHVA